MWVSCIIDLLYHLQCEYNKVGYVEWVLYSVCFMKSVHVLVIHPPSSLNLGINIEVVNRILLHSSLDSKSPCDIITIAWLSIDLLISLRSIISICIDSIDFPAPHY